MPLRTWSRSSQLPGSGSRIPGSKRATPGSGYASAGHGRLELTDSVRRRLALYTIYLYLIMGIEGATRGWGGPERLKQEQWILGLLDTELGRLDQVRRE